MDLRQQKNLPERCLFSISLCEASFAVLGIYLFQILRKLKKTENESEIKGSGLLPKKLRLEGP